MGELKLGNWATVIPGINAWATEIGKLFFFQSVLSEEPDLA
jgi:hypothetical protein